MLNRKISIQTRLFWSYFILIIGIIIIFITSFYFYSSKTLRERAFNSFQQLSNSISSQLDSEVRRIDILSVNIAHSVPMNELFFTDFSNADEIDIVRNYRDTVEVLYSIVGPLQQAFQINVFNNNGRIIGIGEFSINLNLPVETIEQIPFLEDTLKEGGGKYLTLPHDDIFKIHNTPVISLFRHYIQEFGNEYGYIEVQQSYSKIEEIVDKTLNSSKDPGSGKILYIYNEKGEVFFPYETINDQTAHYYFQEIKSVNSDSSSFSLRNPESNEKEIISFTSSDYTGLTVLVIEEEGLLLAPVFSFTRYIILASIFLLFAGLVLSFLVSRRITIPIRKIHNAIENMSLEVLSPGVVTELNSNVDELVALNNSFREMCKRLNHSINELILSRSQEMQARMLALQSQMNPHFLYNTITVISTMAEEQNNDDIVRICEDLTEMLRYISKSGSFYTKLRNEINYTRNYLSLMKERYAGRLEYTQNIPEKLLDLMIPKLIIQPLVENSLKYGININPPWKIQIRGNYYNNHWRITIQDNGPGFNKKVLQNLNNQLKDISKSTFTDIAQSFQELELEKIGLINIFNRLRLLYKEDAIFKIRNHPGKGAEVTVGGLILKELNSPEEKKDEK